MHMYIIVHYHFALYIHTSLHCKHYGEHTNLQVAGSSEHRFDGSHAVVVVVLGGELLRAEAVGGHDLDREGPGIDKATRVEHNLCNHGVVWHHHGHWPKQGLEVVRELRTT